jgi:NADPH2 dehydrogenase
MPKSKHGRGYALFMPTPNLPSDIFASQIVDEVHAKDSYIFLQLWALGRASDVELLKAEDTSFDLVGASAIPISPSYQTPRPLTVEEIKSYVQWYADAADKAINQAGFDGVELHFANGYLPDQFLQDVSNQRTDEYGGSIENRAKFPLEIIEAVSKVVGEDRVGFRISPWSSFQGMGMKDPKPTFAHLVSRAKERFPDLAYLHLIEPSVNHSNNEAASNDIVKAKGGLVAFGRRYISNVSSLSSVGLDELDRNLTLRQF